jgi:hypothetical protein
MDKNWMNELSNSVLPKIESAEGGLTDQEWKDHLDRVLEESRVFNITQALIVMYDMSDQYLFLDSEENLLCISGIDISNDDRCNSVLGRKICSNIIVDISTGIVLKNRYDMVGVHVSELVK